MSDFIPIPDPFPSKGPIPANTTDFYEREELFITVQNHLLAGDSVSVVGERKAGKTSFLNYLSANLSPDEFIPVFVDTQKIAPRIDKIFLGRLARDAARAIAKAKGLTTPLQTNTLKASAEETYLTFEDDLEMLRSELPEQTDGTKYRLVWLIDEIETLRGYTDTSLYFFLRPIAQSDPHFRFVVAGYDVLYTLSNQSKWSPFYNAFRSTRLEGLSPEVAQQVIDDALVTMDVEFEQNLYDPILSWTGQKPFFLKWALSMSAQTLNDQASNRQFNQNIWQTAKQLFLKHSDLSQYFIHLWETHTTESQQKVLSFVATQNGPYTYPKILNELKENMVIDNYTTQQLVDDLTRLNQLSFLYERLGRYEFTSGCLQDWIKENKPLN